MISLAGSLAEQRYLCNDDWTGAEREMQSARDLAAYVNGSLEQTLAYLDWLTIRARQVVTSDHVWPMVEALAHALIDKGTIGYRNAIAIMKEAGVRARKQDAFYGSMVEFSNMCSICGKYDHHVRGVNTPKGEKTLCTACATKYYEGRDAKCPWYGEPFCFVDKLDDA